MRGVTSSSDSGRASACSGPGWRQVEGRGLEVQGFRNSGREELRNGATTASCSKNWPPSFSDTRLQPRISKEQVKYHLGQLGQGKNGGGACLSTSSARTFPVSLRSALSSSWNSRLREFRDWPSLEWRIFIQDSLIHSFIPVLAWTLPRFKSLLISRNVKIIYYSVLTMFLSFSLNQPQNPTMAALVLVTEHPGQWQDRCHKQGRPACHMGAGRALVIRLSGLAGSPGPAFRGRDVSQGTLPCGSPPLAQHPGVSKPLINGALCLGAWGAANEQTCPQLLRAHFQQSLSTWPLCTCAWLNHCKELLRTLEETKAKPCAQLTDLAVDLTA